MQASCTVCAHTRCTTYKRRIDYRTEALTSRLYRPSLVRALATPYPWMRVPPWRQPTGKLMVSLVNSHAHATLKRWHLWQIDLRFALSSTAEFSWVVHRCTASSATRTCSLSLSLSISHSRTHSRTLSLSHSLAHTLSLKHTLSHSLAHTHTHTLSQTHSLTLSHTHHSDAGPQCVRQYHRQGAHALSLSHSRSLAPSLTHSLSHTHSVTLSPILSPSHTLSQTLDPNGYATIVGKARMLEQPKVRGRVYG